MIRKDYQEIIERMGWTIREYQDESADICQYSPAGEDFSFSINTSASSSDIAQQVFIYSEDFDADDHAELWLEARHKDPSVPRTIRELIDDADAIKEMLSELADALLAERRRAE